MAVISRTTASERPEARVASGDLTGDEYMELVQSKDATARAAAAGRADAPLGALLAFAQDTKTEVRLAVASNPGIGRTTTLIAHLGTDKAAEVVRALLRNPAVPRWEIERIAENGSRVARDLARAHLG